MFSFFLTFFQDNQIQPRKTKKLRKTAIGDFFMAISEKTTKEIYSLKFGCIEPLLTLK